MLSFIYSCDEKYFEIFLTSALSVRKKYGTNVNIFLITYKDIDAKYKSILKKIKIQTFLVDGEDMAIFNDWIGVTNNEKSILRFGRFLIPQLSKKFNLEGDIIYLDSDTFVNRKLNTKYFFGNKNNYAFVQDKSGTEYANIAINFWKKLLGTDNAEASNKIELLINNNLYFNSGVLIINDIELYKKLIKKILNSNLKLNDQNMLNIYNEGEIIPVYDPNMNQFLKRGWSIKTRIFHFAGTRARPFIKRDNQSKSWKIAYKYMGWDKYHSIILSELKK